MKTFTACFCFLLLTSSVLPQGKRAGHKAPPKPATSIQTATTKDGRTVLLKSDGTWEYSADPVGSPSPSVSPETSIQAAPVATPSPEVSKDVEILGNWLLKITSASGPGNPAMLRITPDEAGTFLGKLDLGINQSPPPQKVTVSNGHFKVAFSTSANGGSIELAFDGEFSSAMIKGSVVLTQGGQVTLGTFVGTPASSASIAGVGSLTIQAGIVYKLGGAQPVARTTFHLLRRDLAEILSGAGLRPDKNMNLLQTFAFAYRYQGSNRNYANFFQVASAAIQPNIVASTVTDFSGVAQFPSVPIGAYYLVGYTETRGGFALWDVMVAVNGGSVSVVLDQNNAAIAL